MPMFACILVVLLALLAAAFLALMVVLKMTVRKRDQVRRPEERSYGAGARRALLLYQPSNRRANLPLTEAMAQAVADLGYTVTVNHPSEQLPYDLQDYDLLIFGSGVYMGGVAQPLKKYLTAHPVAGKRVMLYATGLLSDAPELRELEGLFLPGNTVDSIKLKPTEAQRLLDFVRTHAS